MRVHVWTFGGGDGEPQVEIYTSPKGALQGAERSLREVVDDEAEISRVLRELEQSGEAHAIVGTARDECWMSIEPRYLDPFSTQERLADLIGALVEYAAKCGEINDEPVDGDCWRAVEAGRKLLADTDEHAAHAHPPHVVPAGQLGFFPAAWSARLDEEVAVSARADVAQRINAICEREGWAVFNDDHKIQRDDEMAVFDSDDAAIAHCWRCAEAGSAPHQIALALHFETDPSWHFQ